MMGSLRSKLVFIMLILIVLLMTVVLVFLIRGVQDFYANEFFSRMETVFTDKELLSALRAASGEADAAELMQDILSAYAGQLGIDTGTRNFFILDGVTGALLADSSPNKSEQPGITPNILTALTGRNAWRGDSGAGYMDVAVPIESGGGARFVVYIRDDKQTVQSVSAELFKLILEAVAVGFVISAAISVILSNTILQPIRGMTSAAEAMADGDFSQKIAVESGDELGVLSGTFNTMASQLEATLEELTKAEKLRRDFVANVSHELRTPLTSIRTYAETLAENDDLPEDTRAEFLRVILNESDRMTKIVQDLLELSKFDSGNAELNMEEFSLDRSLREVYAAISLPAEQRGHRINLELEWKLPDVTGDRARIEQVLMNIMTNAVKYTPGGGEIDITSGRSGANVWVKISDTGIGIPPEDIPHIFDRFYRVDKARSRESGGTGLGLAIAHEIIVRHGGEILVESAPGAGTAMTVLLPIEGRAYEA